MARASNRNVILIEGGKVIHARGFAATGIREIVQAAGVPQGSFTNHFASKEAFALEVLELWHAELAGVMAQTLAGDQSSPLRRLEDFIDAMVRRAEGDGLKTGSLLGNLAAEQPTKRIRKRVAEIYEEMEAAVADVLKDAVRTGEISESIDAKDLAGVIVAGLEGAALLAKAGRSAAPLKRFRRVLFANLLAG